jgi:hypothetical protein
MLEIIKTLDQKHYTNTKVMTKVLVRCYRCGGTSEMVRQNAVKHNQLGRTHCQHCIGDAYHRMTNTRIWRIWLGMKHRAKNTLDKNYRGRGIRMCQEWEDFTKFYADMSEGYSDDLTIERVDVNGMYCKENCIWLSIFDQQANKRNNRVVVYRGEKMHLAELCRRSGFSKMMMVMRLNRGMSGDEAVADAQKSPYGKGHKAIKKRMCLT